MEVQPQTKSQHISLSTQIDRSIILPRQVKHFNLQEELLIKVIISEGKTVFNQQDYIIVGSQTVSWYMSRVGEFYFKSNDDFDAKHIGIDNTFSLAEIETWRAVAIENSCFLEVQLKGGQIHRSLKLKSSELNAINELQAQLNRLIQTSH